MGVELRPLGVRCNIRCSYCYQNPVRESAAVAPTYSLDAMKAAVTLEGGPFTLFGGEPLLIPVRDLEALWAWGFETYGSNSVQTNGALITPDHVRLFHRFHVNVGISIDGPGELNDLRWAGTLEATRTTTARTEAAIALLCREGLAPSLIVTLHRGNATAARLPILTAWLRQMEDLGVSAVRLHILEVDDPRLRGSAVLSTADNVAAFQHFADVESQFVKMRFDVFKDMRQLLLGEDKDATCIWRSCDPYTTAAVRGVEGTGQRSNCGRTNKDGVDFAKADFPGFERYLALYNTPQDHGGCQDCRFFLMCKGQCPGTAIDGDWRNRTEHCDVWKELFTRLERELSAAGRVPLSLSGSRPRVERALIDAWSRGDNPSIADILSSAPKALWSD